MHENVRKRAEPNDVGRGFMRSVTARNLSGANMLRHVLPAAIGLLFLAAVGRADDPKSPPAVPPALANFLKLDADGVLKALDKNGDGYLTPDEMPPRLAKLFSRFDTNGDGKLDHAEIE